MLRPVYPECTGGFPELPGSVSPVWAALDTTSQLHAQRSMLNYKNGVTHVPPTTRVQKERPDNQTCSCVLEDEDETAANMARPLSVPNLFTASVVVASSSSCLGMII